jgi:hypothetical protein
LLRVARATIDLCESVGVHTSLETWAHNLRRYESLEYGERTV